MRLAFLSPSGALGGAEASLLDVLASVRDAHPSWRLHLIAAADGPLLARASALGATAEVVAFPRALARLGDHGASGRGVARLATQLGCAAGPIAAYTGRLRRAVAALAPDVVQSNGLKMHVLGGRATDAPLVWHLHDYLGSRPLTSRVLRWTSGRCAAIVANSRSVAADAQQTLGSNAPAVVTIYNGVDLQRFSPSGEAIDLDALARVAPAGAGTVRVGLVATFARWKGHAAFLQALAKLPPTLPLRAYVIGGAVYETDRSQHTADDLREIARAAGVEERIAFTGFVAEPASAMLALDIVVHASTEPEPFGLVIAQAMACGRAVIASRGGGAAELFTDGVDALGHEPGNVERLAAAIHRLAVDPGERERLAAAARGTAERMFDRARLAREFGPVYEKAVRVQRSALGSLTAAS